MATGKIKWFNEEKAYGFITDDKGKDYFVHKNDLPQGAKVRDGDPVSFEIGSSKKGEKATQVELLS